jgi:hypothetical protein
MPLVDEQPQFMLRSRGSSDHGLEGERAMGPDAQDLECGVPQLRQRKVREAGKVLVMMEAYRIVASHADTGLLVVDDANGVAQALQGNLSTRIEPLAEGTRQRLHRLVRRASGGGLTQ